MEPACGFYQVKAVRLLAGPPNNSSVSGYGEIQVRPDVDVNYLRLVVNGNTYPGNDSYLKLPVLRQGPTGSWLEWREPAYHTVVQVLKHPMYAGAFVFGRTTQRTQLITGRARKSMGHHKAMEAWNVLMRDHHPGYITWEQFEANQKMLSANAHMQKRAARKSARGGRALLTGLVRCGRCGRMMRVFYGMRSGHAHRYQCRGDAQAE